MIVSIEAPTGKTGGAFVLGDVMARKLSPMEQVIWMAFSLPTGAGFSYFGILSLSQLGVRIGDGLQTASPTLGVTAVLGAWGLYQLQQLGLYPFGYPQGLWSSRANSKVGVSTTFASIVKVQSSDPDRQSYIHKWKEPLAAEFVFTGRGLMTPIPETTLGRFIKLAWRRQVNALYGSKLNMVYAGGGYKRLTVNQIFSERYFTRDTRPRFDQEDYYGCLHILMVTHSLRGRRQGRGGTLIHSYEQSVERAKALWMPYPAKKRTWSTFGGFLPIREVTQS